MLKRLIDTYSALVQLGLVVLVAVGAWLGYELLPLSLSLGGANIPLIGVVRLAMGGAITFVSAAILFGQQLTQLDERNATRSQQQQQQQQSLFVGSRDKPPRDGVGDGPSGESSRALMSGMTADQLEWAVGPSATFADARNLSAKLLVDGGKKLLACELTLSPSRVIQGSHLSLYDLEHGAKKINSIPLGEQYVAFGTRTIAMVNGFDIAVLVMHGGEIPTVRAVKLSTLATVGSVEVPAWHEVHGPLKGMLARALNSEQRRRPPCPFTLDMFDGLRGVLHDGDSPEMGSRLVSFDLEGGRLRCKPTLTYSSRDYLPVGGIAENRASVALPRLGQMAVGTRLGRIQIWSVTTLSKAAEWDVNASADWSDNQIYSMAASADNARLAVGLCNGTVHVYDVKRRKLVAAMRVPHDGPLTEVPLHLAFCDDTRVLAVAYNDGTIRLWDTATSRQTDSLKLDVTFRHDDQLVVRDGIISWVAGAYYAFGRIDIRGDMASQARS